LATELDGLFEKCNVLLITRFVSDIVNFSGVFNLAVFQDGENIRISTQVGYEHHFDFDEPLSPSFAENYLMVKIYF
jgi:hypothetical protein